MTTTKVDGGPLRTFIINFINNKAFALQAATFAKPELFEGYARQIILWCIAYARDHKDAPGGNVQTIYQTWVEQDNPPETDAVAVREFLQSMSDEADNAPPPNTPYLLQEFKKYVTRRQILATCEQAKAQVEMGEIDLALDELHKFRTPSKAVQGELFFPLDPAEAGRSREKPEQVIPWPGAADHYLGRFCHREALIGIQAPGKRGKTFLCLEFAYRALRARRRVAFFQTGDLTRLDMEHRLYARIGQTPVIYPHHEGLQPGEFRCPTGIKVQKDEAGRRVPLVEYTVKKAKRYSPDDMAPAVRAFNTRFRINYKNLAVGVYPNNTINVAGCEAELEKLEQEHGFVPDVIIFDYADIMAPEPSAKKYDLRDKQNETFLALRRLSQERKACVVCPTQANADAYKTEAQSESNFSNDQRKGHNVTALLAIDQNVKEREMQVARLNWIMVRSDEKPRHPLYVAQCLPLGMALCQCAI